MKVKSLMFVALCVVLMDCTLLIGAIRAECPSIIKLGQTFISKGPETGKGTMVQVSCESGLVKSQTITDCNMHKLTYSFYAARYGNTHKDSVSVRIEVLLNDGQKESYDEVVDAQYHTSDYSRIDSVGKSCTGSLEWKGTPKQVNVTVIPGDWGLEIRRLEIKFQ